MTSRASVYAFCLLSCTSVPRDVLECPSALSGCYAWCCPDYARLGRRPRAVSPWCKNICGGRMRITDIVLTRVHGHYHGPHFPPGNSQITQLALYPPLSPSPPPDPADAKRPIRGIYVEILTALRPFLLGRDPLAGELLHDQMLRMHRHGRSGLFVMAISAIDCALWDLKGKAWGLPVYRLLGGPTRAAVPAYASMLGFAVAPDQAAATALDYRAAGYSAQKWFFAYGPGDGEAGTAANLALAQALREALGLHYPLMFDAFMGWGVAYAREMVS